MSMISNEARTWFDYFPIEIILSIFDYLSNNDIIYTFFYFNKTMNNLLLNNRHYLNCLYLPIKDLNIWQNIFEILGSQIECLIIDKMILSFPLIYFPNIKSLIILSSHGFPNEELKSIFESDQFNNLHKFKIIEEEFFSHENNSIYSNNENNVFEKIFNNQNSLRIFQYSLEIPIFNQMYTNNFQTNFNLHSLTLTLNNFQHIFSLIKYAPNLIYLNVHLKSSGIHEESLNNINIKLKKLYITFMKERYRNIDFKNLIRCIKQFSLSLICLSLNLINCSINISNNLFPLNSLYLQEFLESMIELKQFHLYAQIDTYKFHIDKNNILSQFKNQYWLDKNLSFEMHGNYFYTLPFQFQYFHDVYYDINDIRSNNRQIWFNVKSIELPVKIMYNLTFLKQLKIKMPKLTSIKFFSHHSSLIIKTNDFNLFKNLIEEFDVTLDNVTTIDCTNASIQFIKEFIIYVLPNLKHLILNPRDILAIDNQLIPIFNKRIRRLDIEIYSTVESLIEIDHVCFSNVKHIYIGFEYITYRSLEYANIIMTILNNFKNLKILTIYIFERFTDSNTPSVTEWKELIGHLKFNEILKNYQVKNLQKNLLFSKRII